MASVIAEFFQVILGEVSAYPNTMQELIPYLLTIFIGLCLVAMVFRIFGKLAECLLNYTRFR